ncbi:Phosphoglycerol transferase MdoB [Chitinophaga terrae (ex Kim and Jung 2007)]|uniref:Phosphoglycerol transferase MdoB n=1 Tax=Chitinophaga terrae (ex Kim and Jung 2007) TaxID=408074 RepID=A0A1H3ZY82_9BACT|nr:alkaline phosphatase family protein [Chitinophaga terrae (ex Kim and Jung 2007)]MDQ0106132.1 phosphoglycerol transferase MdoB-like AlkP superfamily enzyme [Chitinophaga terrae (ex Kim and Jung 2007)]GEP93167.1 sulfatase [Chitinophaga terrae (ex Kim and Jung 2007)]SEA28666.1 Phosphoglycerol transferase MdoB [Chitinophaga terrae (ex Kim and Jung 2007)]
MEYSWKNIPRYIRYVFVQTLYLFLLMVMFRVIFYLFFLKTTITDRTAIIKAWNFGLRFDLRLTLYLMIPLLIFVFITRNRFFTSRVIRRVVFGYLFIIYAGLTWLYIVDLGHYAYLGQRLDPSILRFFAKGERADNARMVWQSYPVVKGVAGIIIFLYLVYLLQKATWRRFAGQPVIYLRNLPFTGYVVGTVLLFAAGIYGNLAYFPLRWSQAMFTRDNGITSLGLNPILYFISNFSVDKDTFDKKTTQQYYPAIANYLKTDTVNAETLSYVRTVAADSSKPRLNIVLVMLESTGAAVTSMYGNPMQATPNMQRLADSGILFKNFYVPAISTAKTVFGVHTGLPDITGVKTASRHPKMLDQRIVMDQFKGYERLYLLGGNTNWANIRAVFTNNVEGIRIYEEGMYKSPKADVWGISDYDLITEASEIFKKENDQKKPFIAFLQLADNHPPYTTTPGAGDFKKLAEKDLDMKKFKQSGFVSVDQFNALRYEDYNVGHLVDLAKKDGYLDNTIFVFFGDHNCVLDPYHFMPLPEYELATGGVHVTAFMYSPKHIKPQVIDAPASLLDVYPTVAGLVGMPYRNYTLGINIFDSTRAGNDRYAFIQYIRNQMPYFAVIGSQYLFEVNTRTHARALYDLKADPMKDISAQQPGVARSLDSLANGFYESTRYLMFNNKKQ